MPDAAPDAAADAAADRRRRRRYRRRSYEAETKPLGDLVFDVTEGTSNLVREEIELAKAEVTEKVAQARCAARSSASPPASSPSSP